MGGRGSNNNERLERGGRSTTGGKLKWTKRNDQGAGALGQGYQSGGYVIKETYKSAELQKQNGGKISDYYWELSENGKVLKYAKTAKALKEYAETLNGPAKSRRSGALANGPMRAGRGPTNKDVKDAVRQFFLESGKKPSEVKNADLNEIQRRLGASGTQMQNAFNYFQMHYPSGYSLNRGPHSNEGKVRAKYPNADHKLYNLAGQGIKVHDTLPKGYKRAQSQRRATLPPSGFYWATSGPNGTGDLILVKERR